jgi:apolipoprotein N-acyltransferase
LDVAPNSVLIALADALAAGGIPAVLIAVATYATGMDLQPLARWQGIAGIKFLVVLAAGDVAYFLLRRRARWRVMPAIVAFVIAAILSLYLYSSGAGVPENAGQLSTWNGTLFTLYFLFLTFFGAAFGSIYATVRSTK